MQTYKAIIKHDVTVNIQINYEMRLAGNFPCSLYYIQLSKWFKIKYGIKLRKLQPKKWLISTNLQDYKNATF